MTINKSPRIGVAQHVLRRLTTRALKVIERHRDKHGAIEAYEASFVPVATRYMEAYDRSRTAGPGRKKEVAEADLAVANLRNTVLAWAAHLERDIPGIELGVFKRGHATPDDVIDSTARLLDTIAARGESEAGPLPYSEKMVADIETARESAIKERGEAQDLMAVLQEESAAVRGLAAEVQAGLVGLRRTLRATLGSPHRDYQKLRQIRARVVDEEDVEVAAGEAEVGDEVVVPGGEVPAGVDEEELVGAFGDGAGGEVAAE